MQICSSYEFPFARSLWEKKNLTNRRRSPKSYTSPAPTILPRWEIVKEIKKKYLTAWKRKC